MNGIEPLLSSPWAQALGWGLLHSLWQGALIALALAGTLAWMRQSSAAARYAVALIALTGTYAAWLETRDFTAFDDPYVRILAIKVVVAEIAFVAAVVAELRGW